MLDLTGFTLKPGLQYRRLPGCVVMGINRTRRLFGSYAEKGRVGRKPMHFVWFSTKVQSFSFASFFCFLICGRGNYISGK